LIAGTIYTQFSCPMLFSYLYCCIICPQIPLVMKQKHPSYDNIHDWERERKKSIKSKKIHSNTPIWSSSLVKNKTEKQQQQQQEHETRGDPLRIPFIFISNGCMSYIYIYTYTRHNDGYGMAEGWLGRRRW